MTTPYPRVDATDDGTMARGRRDRDHRLAAQAVPSPAAGTVPHWHEDVPQLGTGRPGKQGQLDLHLATGALGRTRIRACAHRAPLQLGRLLYPDAGCPEMAYCYTAMLTGGLVQGDRLEQRITVEAGARAHVTTLAATKVYRMTRNFARQDVHLTVAAGGVLEWWPDPLILFRDARFHQEVHLTVDHAGTLVYGDLVLPGRTGERHDFAYYQTRVTARRVDGSLLFADVQALAPPPPGARPLRETLPADRQVIGTMITMCPASAVPTLLDATRLQIERWDATAVLAGCTTLPGDCGVAVRVLTADGQAARRALHALWHVERGVLLQTGAPLVRKC